jgi:hypothetical protein
MTLKLRGRITSINAQGERQLALFVRQAPRRPRGLDLPLG